jgi:hypothetical protein
MIFLPFDDVLSSESFAPCSPQSALMTTVISEHDQINLTNDGAHLDSIPDYYQNDTAFGGFPDGGQMYCGPVAVSNSLMHIISNGVFLDTLPDFQFKKNQHALISKIASSRYIGTGPRGTSPADICNGVEKFLSEENYTGATLSYCGWRPVPTKYRKKSFPDFTFAEKILYKTRTAVWLNFGWYSYHKDRNQYFRRGGHWVTLISYLHSDTPIIVVHDPATSKAGNDTITLTRLTDGQLTGKMAPLPVYASGYYRFTNKSGQYGIIDGFITLEK